MCYLECGYLLLADPVNSRTASMATSNPKSTPSDTTSNTASSTVTSSEQTMDSNSEQHQQTGVRNVQFNFLFFVHC